MNAVNVLPIVSSASLSEKMPDARDRILAAAQNLFAMRGFEGVSTTQIAKVAGITQPLIHYHFKNKEALWKATVARLFSRLQDEYLAVVSRLPRHDSQRFLTDAIRHYIAFSAKYPEFGQFVMREGVQSSDRLDWMTEHWMKPALREFKTLYEQAVTDGWMKPIPFQQLVMLITSSASHYFSLSPLMRSLYGVDPLDPEQQAQQGDAVVKLVLSAIMVESREALSA